LNAKWKFIVTYGVFYWGISTFLVSSALNHFWHHKAIVAANFYIDLPIWMFSGVLFGMQMWIRKCRRERNQRSVGKSNFQP
jgi:hypothetical protein